MKISFLQIYFLTLRNIISRYRNFKIALFWSLSKSLILLMVLTFVFQFVIEMKINTKVSYVFYILSGLIVWLNFSNNLNDLSESLLNNNMLIKNLYINKNNIFLSYIFLNVLELFIMTFILIILLIFFDNLKLSINFFYLSFCIIILQIINYSIGSIFSFFLCKYRELRHLIQIVLQLGIFINPIAYTLDFIPDNLKIYYYFNPLLLPLDFYRYSIGITEKLNLDLIYYSSSTILIILILSFYIKRKFNYKVNQII